MVYHIRSFSKINKQNSNDIIQIIRCKKKFMHDFNRARVVEHPRTERNWFYLFILFIYLNGSQLHIDKAQDAQLIAVYM